MARSGPVVVEREIFKSQAYRGLSRWAMLVLADFLMMRQMVKVKSKHVIHWDVGNNGQLVYPYATAEDNGIRAREFRAALNELVERGFLDIAEYGNGGIQGKVTKYSLDDRWKKFGKPDFQPPKNPMRKDTRSGRGWQAYNLKQEQKSMTNLSAEPMTNLSIEQG